MRDQTGSQATAPYRSSERESEVTCLHPPSSVCLVPYKIKRGIHPYYACNSRQPAVKQRECWGDYRSSRLCSTPSSRKPTCHVDVTWMPLCGVLFPCILVSGKQRLSLPLLNKELV